MKAKRYAVSVQYGAGHHFFMGYHDDLPEAVDQATVISETRIRDYDNRKGRRGVRPRVMVWQQVGISPDTIPTTSIEELKLANAKLELARAGFRPDVEVLNGSEFMERPSARESLPGTTLATGKPGHHFSLEVISDGALAGNS